jgi:histidinol phosphatase-like enzyme
MNRKAVFLDLNGTLVLPMKQESLADLYPIPGAIAAVARLSDAGFVCPVITVQSRIAKGLFTAAEFLDWFQNFATTASHQGAELQGPYVSPHRFIEPCDCKKPGTRLYEQAIRDEFNRALSWTFQDMLAALSLELHRVNPDSLVVQAFSRQVAARYLPIPMPSDLSLATTFDHLGSAGYSATYYTYIWSKALAKDLWTGFDHANPLAPGPAARNRDLVLEPGGAVPADVLLRNFLGRPWNMDAWERWMAGNENRR